MPAKPLHNHFRHFLQALCDSGQANIYYEPPSDPYDHKYAASIGVALHESHIDQLRLMLDAGVLYELRHDWAMCLSVEDWQHVLEHPDVVSGRERPSYHLLEKEAEAGLCVHCKRIFATVRKSQ